VDLAHIPIAKQKRLVAAVSCKPGSDAWDIVQGLVSARRRASLVPTPPLQKPAFRPNLPLPFLLSLSQGTILRQTLLGENILGGFARIAMMPRRHGDTRFDFERT